ncbi:hypothetical protein NDU88_001459 [Pleurodeles waltl]|uniref:Uncharacterized protein n=1 Tax=Pleurodeles waltl TaxID=8319 RepID=A0AAV7KRJ2_PLEWA|nr:hypothetical protein NDU88_001459 [Pleurodeles waltl]
MRLSYLQATRSRPSRQSHDPQARREKAFNRGGGKREGGPRHNTTADKAPPSTPMIDAPEAIQVPGGKRRPVPLSAAAGSTPRPQEASSTPHTAPQLSPLQRGEAVNIRRPPSSHRLAISVLTG